MKSFKEYLTEAKNISISVQMMSTKQELEKIKRKYKINIEMESDDEYEDEAEVTGTKENLLKFLTGNEMDMSKEDIKGLFPELS